MIIVLDTNAVAATVGAELAPVIQLTAYAKRCGGSVFLPEVVRKEFIAYLDRYAAETIDKLSGIERRIPSSPASQKHIAALRKAAHAARRLSIRKLRELEHRHRLNSVPITAAHARRAVDRATLRKPPCNPKGEELRDAMIWEAVLALLKRRQGPLILITADHGFFADVLDQEVAARGAALLRFKTIEAFLDDVTLDEDTLPPQIIEKLCDTTDLGAWLAVDAVEDPFTSWDSAVSNYIEGGVLNQIAGAFRIKDVSKVNVTGGLRRYIARDAYRAHIAFETYVWVECESFQWEQREPGQHGLDLSTVSPEDPLRKLYDLIPVHVPVGEPELVDIDFHVHGEAVFAVTRQGYEPTPIAMYADIVAAGIHGGEMTSHKLSIDAE